MCICKAHLKTTEVHQVLYRIEYSLEIRNNMNKTILSNLKHNDNKTINMKHTTLSYIYLFNTHTYFISNLHLTYLYILKL